MFSFTLYLHNDESQRHLLLIYISNNVTSINLLLPPAIGIKRLLSFKKYVRVESWGTRFTFFTNQDNQSRRIFSRIFGYFNQSAKLHLSL